MTSRKDGYGRALEAGPGFSSLIQRAYVSSLTCPFRRGNLNLVCYIISRNVQEYDVLKQNTEKFTLLKSHLRTEIISFLLYVYAQCKFNNI